MRGQVPLGTNTSIRGATWGSRFAQDIADYGSIRYDNLLGTQQGRDRTAGVRGDNLTDDAKFIGLGLPGPGRSFRVGVTLTL